MRNIIGQAKNTVDIGKVMNEGKILLVNLSKGDLGEANSGLLGSVLVNMIMIASFQRRPIPVKQRRPFHLIVDEIPNFATESFTILQSEARKYAVDVVVAHQFRDQLDDLRPKVPRSTLAIWLFSGSMGAIATRWPASSTTLLPPADTRVEPYFWLLQLPGRRGFLVETKLSTGEGKLYEEVELPRRPYNDVEFEMANQLSILPNFQAWCHLIYRSALSKGGWQAKAGRVPHRD